MHEDLSAQQLHERLRKDGGFTHQPVSHETPKEGFALSILPGHEQVFARELSPEDVSGFLEKNASLFEQNPDAFMGAWVDQESGKVYLDVSVVVSDRETAVSLARAHNQEGIFDLGKGETVIVKDAAERRKARPPAVRSAEDDSG